MIAAAVSRAPRPEFLAMINRRVPPSIENPVAGASEVLKRQERGLRKLTYSCNGYS